MVVVQRGYSGGMYKPQARGRILRYGTENRKEGLETFEFNVLFHMI